MINRAILLKASELRPGTIIEIYHPDESTSRELTVIKDALGHHLFNDEIYFDLSEEEESLDDEAKQR